MLASVSSWCLFQAILNHLNCVHIYKNMGLGEERSHATSSVSASNPPNDSSAHNRKAHLWSLAPQILLWHLEYIWGLQVGYPISLEDQNHHSPNSAYPTLLTWFCTRMAQVWGSLLYKHVAETILKSENIPKMVKMNPPSCLICICVWISLRNNCGYWQKRWSSKPPMLLVQHG